MLNYINRITNHNPLILDDSDKISTYSNDEYGYIKFVIPFIKDHYGYKLQFMIYFPYTIKTLKRVFTAIGNRHG